MVMPVNDLPIGEEVHEHDSVIVLGVSRTIKKRGSRLSDLLSKLFHGLRIPLEFILVAPAKLIPFLGIVTEPASQLSAWRKVFQPGVNMSVVLADAARP